MQIKTFAVTALAAVFLAGCAAQQPAAKKAEKKAAAAKPAPKLLTGASAAMLASTCEGCHGTGGVSSGPATPSIAGMSEDYLVEVMDEFKSGDTRTTIMTRIAKGYTDEEIEQMASYFAAVPYVAANQSVDAGKARKGAMVHEEFCSDCHKDGGSDVSDDTGLLAGQWMPYLHYTLEDYNSGERLISRKMKKKMDAMLAQEGKAGLEALIHYYGSQK